jgi:hypothetical protein
MYKVKPREGKITRPPLLEEGSAYYQLNFGTFVEEVGIGPPLLVA